MKEHKSLKSLNKILDCNNKYAAIYLFLSIFSGLTYISFSILFSMGVNNISDTISRKVIVFLLIAIMLRILTIFVGRRKIFYNKKLRALNKIELQKRFTNIIENQFWDRLFKYNLSDIRTRFFDDLDETVNLFSTVIDLLSSVIIFVIILIIFSTINITLVLLMLILIPAIYFVITRTNSEFYNKTNKLQQDRSLLNDEIEHYVSNAHKLKQFNATDFFLKRYKNNRDNTYDSELIVYNHERTVWAFEIIFHQIYITLSFVIGALLLYNNLISIGSLLVIFMLSFYLIDNAFGIIFQYINYKKAISKVDRFLEIIDHNFGEIVKEFKPGYDYLQVKNLSYAYDNKAALNNISFKINNKQKILVAGHSGSGKSTLLNCLSGVFEGFEGSIELDQKNILEVENYRNNLAYFSQNIQFANTSIKEVILLHSEISEEDFETTINDIAKRVGLHSEIIKMPNKYDTKVAELSTGQIQRLAWITILLKDFKMLIVDEGLANIDKKNKNILYEELKLIKSNVIMSSHIIDDQFAKIFDLILILKDGNIVFSGEYEELVNDKSFQYIINDSQ